MEEKRSGASVALTANDRRPDDESQEKTTIGGEFNSGVTSDDADTKDKIEKQATILKEQPANDRDSESDS